MTQPAATDAFLLGPLCPAFPDTWLGTLGCTLAEWEAVVLVLVVLAVAGGVAVTTLARRRRIEALRGPTFLVFPLGSGTSRARKAAPSSKPAPDPSAPAVGDPRPTSPRPTSSSPPSSSPNQRMVISTTPGPRVDPPQRRPQEGPPEGPRRVEAGHVRFEEPPEGTLQLLPGRLEIQSGTGQGREIRFVRVPGTDPEVTFGRAEGPPYRHIQLDSPTVSRQHARMRFDGTRWSIANESSTNPTLVNGVPVDGAANPPPLEDGDRIELGEVVFLFHQPESHDRLAFRSSWFSDQGRRPTNQDAVAVRTLAGQRELAVVCDGMGSHTAGAVASHGAMEALIAALDKGENLRAAVRKANKAVRRHATGDPDGAGIGTTMVALLRDGGQYQIANVGDSRAYRVGPEGIVQVTVDHSFVAEAVREGRMSFEEANRSPWKNAVTRHLGAEPQIEVDLFGAFSAEEPHLIMLTSDGAHSVLDSDALEGILRGTPSVQDMAREVGEAALRQGSDDNVSVAILAFGGGLPVD